MKKYFSFIGIILIVVMLAGCSKDEPVTYTKFSTPDWQIDKTGKNPYSMTAVVQLSDTLKKSFNENDQLAAFINNECRGTGVLVKTNVSYVYFVLIHGTAAEISKVSFKYYSAIFQYIYITSPFLDFTVDGIVGSPDKPKTLLLTPTN